jgi:hypothetical protein
MIYLILLVIEKQYVDLYDTIHDYYTYTTS